VFEFRAPFLSLCIDATPRCRFQTPWPTPRRPKRFPITVMPKGRIYNRTKGSTFPNGLVFVVRASITNTKGVYVDTPKELEVQVG
jgi:hypothetical protein